MCLCVCAYVSTIIYICCCNRVRRGLHSVSLSSASDSSTATGSLNKSVDDLRSVSQNFVTQQLSSPSGSDFSGSTATSSGASYISSSLVPKAAYLIPQSAGPSVVSVTSSKHLSELLYACQAGDLPIVKKMTRDDSSLLFARDLSGRSAFHFACSYGRYDSVSLGADPDSNSGETPLHVACISGQAKIIQLLISHVSNIDAMDKGQTMLPANGETGCLNIYVIKEWIFTWKTSKTGLPYTSRCDSGIPYCLNFQGWVIC